MEDTIRQKGFLSQEINNYQVRYRERYAHVFQISDQVSQDATALIFGTNMRQLQGGTTQPKLMAVAYWLRSVRTCQGALRMLEIGMVPEAQILLRSAYEFLFFGAALIKDETVISRLELNDAYERVKQAEKMLKSPSVKPDEIASLNQVIEKFGHGKNSISTYDAAQIAGMTEQYDHIYRGLSLTGSHGTATGTDWMLQGGADSFGLVYGPNDVHLEFTLHLTVTCLGDGLSIFRSVVSQWPANGQL